MSGDVIETALSDAIRASDYGDQATQEGLTDFYDRAARAALSVVRDELAARIDAALALCDEAEWWRKHWMARHTASNVRGSGSGAVYGTAPPQEGT